MFYSAFAMALFFSMISAAKEFDHLQIKSYVVDMEASAVVLCEHKRVIWPLLK